MEIAVIGSGAWGSSLALIANRAGNKVTIFSNNQYICEEINHYHTNQNYLPNINLPEDIKATSNIKDIVNNDLLMLVTPAQTIRKICENLAIAGLPKDKIILICSKGIERNSLKLMSEIVEEILPKTQVAILSGPNFALPIAENKPAITSIAAKDIELAKYLSERLSNINFRIYPNDDIIGTQIVGAAKNVLAIALGMCIGKNLGENANAAIFSRGINEIANLIKAKNGNVETLLSPAGIGDLYLTCGSNTSRNTSFGIEFASKNHIDTEKKLIEGFYTAESIVFLAKSLNVEMPIANSVYAIIHQNLPLDKAIESLLNRHVIF